MPSVVAATELFDDEPVGDDRDWLGGMRVHPLADMFPMMADDELQALADDIKANGLLHPIVRTVDGKTLVEGRNRLKACDIADVDPVFDDRIHDDDEARALIMSANVTRRHLSKSQQAMATAILYPEAKRGRGHKDEAVKDEETSPFTHRLLQQARSILRDRDKQLVDAKRNGGGAPIDNVAGIMNGSVHFDSAYQEAQERARAAGMRADRIKKLRATDPDLADEVERSDKELSVAEAEAKQRYQQWLEARRSGFMDLSIVLAQVAGFAASEHRQRMAGWLDVEEVETIFRNYFPGGIPELLEKASSFEAGVAALKRILFSFQARSRK